MAARKTRSGDSRRKRRSGGSANKMQMVNPMKTPVKIGPHESEAEIALPFRDRVIIHPEPFDLRAKNFDPRLDVRVVWKFHVSAIPRHAPGLEQMRLPKILERNVNPRRERSGGRGFARHFLDRTS